MARRRKMDPERKAFINSASPKKSSKGKQPCCQHGCFPFGSYYEQRENVFAVEKAIPKHFDTSCAGAKV